MVNLGNRLKNLRIQTGMTQADVAKKINSSASSIGAYEIGTRRPSYEILIKLARLYQVTADYLLGMDQKGTVDLSGLTMEERTALLQLIHAIQTRTAYTSSIE